ncbi:permease for cytosine/purines, uracil, thiamine, allantoin-domain-containing protein [Schizophyllum commune]
MKLSRLRIEAEDVHFETGCDGEVIRCQRDLLPVAPLPDGPRKWGTFHLLGYWIAEGFGAMAFINQYQTASTAVASGLSPGATIGAVFLGHGLVSIACALNAWVGATYGINFPVFARASFGIRGTTLAVLCRAVSAIVWFGTQSYQGGQCVAVMISAIWPSFKRFPNHLPESAHVTSSQLLCFFLFYLMQLPCLYIHISKLRYLFLFKVMIMPIFGLTLFGWAVGRAHGFGPIFSEGTASGSIPPAVMFFSAMTSAIAGKATLALNICDFTRYAKSPRTAALTNVFALTVPVTLCVILGVVVTSAAQVIYGVSTWNPLQVCELWNNRPAQFFAGFCWALSVLVTNISANSTAVGNDLAILFPKYVNIRRGQYICAVLAVATCPWIIQNSATSFTAFLGGYSIFLGPICGIMLADYFILRRRYMNLTALYRHGPAPYWYWHGFNLRAVAAFTLALIPNLPGFVAKVNNHNHIPKAATYIFSCVWPVGVLVSAALYLIFSAIWAPSAIPRPPSPAERSSSKSSRVMLGRVFGWLGTSFLLHGYIASLEAVRSEKDCLPVSLSLHQLNKAFQGHLLDFPGFVRIRFEIIFSKERVRELYNPRPPRLTSSKTLTCNWVATVSCLGILSAAAIKAAASPCCCSLVMLRRCQR